MSRDSSSKTPPRSETANGYSFFFPKNHLDSILTGSAKSEKTNRVLEASAAIQWPTELRSALDEIRDAIKDLAGAISKDKRADTPAEPEKKEANEGAVLVLSEDEEKSE